MSDKEKLNDLIENAEKPTIYEWVYEVESFLNQTSNNSNELRKLIDNVKRFKNSFDGCAKLIALLKQLYKNKYECIALPPITKRNQIFVAMMFSADMASIYENGYKKVIQSLNYAAMRIDEKEYTGSIINEITSEITDSVALIADLTGNRGGVYYEAGIARGLQLCNHPIKLILTCRKDFFDNERVHFDVSGDNILLYNNLDDLVKKLKPRIVAILSQQGI